MTTDIDRRRFLTAAGGTAAVAAAAGVGGELLISKRYRANMAPASPPPFTPPSIKPVPPPGKLRARGVTVFAGSDNIRDCWSPYGNGDMLDRAAIIAERHALYTNRELEEMFALTTGEADKALGAPRRHVLALMLTMGGRLVLVGLVIGVGASLASTQLLRSQLFGIGAADPLAYAAVAALLGLVAFVACYIPARRAAGVDPMVALRTE